MNYLDGRICNVEGLNNDDDDHSDVKKLFAFFYSLNMKAQKYFKLFKISACILIKF